MNRGAMRRARIRAFPKVGWRNRLARGLLSLKKRPASTRFLDYQTKTQLLLPFNGEWYVYWGGRTVGQNQHAMMSDKRFAYDFLILRQGSSGHSSEPHLHYHLQNTPVLYAGNGLPAQFIDYFADGEHVTRGEPVARQTVRSRREHST